MDIIRQGCRPFKHIPCFAVISFSARLQLHEWTEAFEFDKSLIAVEFGVGVVVGVNHVCLCVKCLADAEENAIYIICQQAMRIEVSHFEGWQGVSVENDEVIAQFQAWVGEAGVTPEGKLSVG